MLEVFLDVNTLSLLGGWSLMLPTLDPRKCGICGVPIESSLQDGGVTHEVEID